MAKRPPNEATVTREQVLAARRQAHEVSASTGAQASVAMAETFDQPGAVSPRLVGHQLQLVAAWERYRDLRDDYQAQEAARQLAATNRLAARQFWTAVAVAAFTLVQTAIAVCGALK